MSSIATDEDHHPDCMVQKITENFDPAIAAGYGPAKSECVITIRYVSRGLGHQIGPRSAYKDVRTVVASAEATGFAKKVAFLKPLICIKG